MGIDWFEMFLRGGDQGFLDWMRLIWKNWEVLHCRIGGGRMCEVCTSVVCVLDGLRGRNADPHEIDTNGLKWFFGRRRVWGN